MGYSPYVKGMTLIRVLNRHPNWGEYRDRLPIYISMADAIHEGIIRLRLHRIPPEAIRVAASRRYHPNTSESEAHMILKRIATEWMRMEGATDVRREAPMFGHKLDVYSDEMRWVIECGHTPPTRLFNLAEDIDRPHRLMVLPFNRNFRCAEDLGSRIPPLRAVEFMIPQELIDRRVAYRMEGLRKAAQALDLRASLPTQEPQP